MKVRHALSRALCASSAAFLLAVSPAVAQGEPKTAPQSESAAARDPKASLSTSLDRLRKAPDVTAAKTAEDAIWSIWLKSGSDTADLLLNWAVDAMGDKQYDRAVEYLDAVVELQPAFAEAWNKRATVHFMREDYGQSLRDLRATLALEPNHFGALAGLGVILQEIDQKPRALEAFRRALAIHPHMENAKKAIEKLAIEVEGREL